MSLNHTRARPLLQSCDLTKLFIEELGWEPCRQKLALRVSEEDFTFTAFAEKRGFTAWLCESPKGGLPDHSTRLKLDRKLSETSFEHLIVFVTADRSRQSWTWVRREQGKPLAARTHDFYRGQPGDSLLQKLESLYVSLAEEEAGLSVAEITDRARAAFDIERVTKAFYRDFDTHRKAFLKFIDGIGDVADREWYASVMLNRLMFVYFIQRKGFLDGDHEYLRHRLDRCKAEQGKDKFYTFYRYFLLRLFHEGFGKRRKDRAPDLEKLLGNIPYLNGGLFDVHELEKPERYGKEIQIPDKAFERIFDYFDQYQWHLDERPLRKDDEINPDVLGYIFEKYINQKQMGAYYTKEDITEYISKNTILPFLFDAARAKCKVAFENSNGPTVWDLLKDNPDRYIYPAVRHGTDKKLPADISAGLDGSAGGSPASLEPSGQAARAPFFDPFAETEISEHKLPHWNQENCYCFITWRLDDAMPKEKLNEWQQERDGWLKHHPKPWDDDTSRRFHSQFSHRLDEWLDAGHGSCVLQQPEIREIIADNLEHFDGQRYELASYVVMPNHVHALIRLKAEHPLADILHSWKSFTAKAINKALNRTGTLWQPEFWDRLIRNESHMSACLGYIRDNPAKATLREGSFTLWERSAGGPPASLDPSGQAGLAPLHERRKAWNKPAPAEFALPTEIWREVVARRQRYWEVWSRLSGREAKPAWVANPPTAEDARARTSSFIPHPSSFSVNDFITLNLDLRQFAQDVIEHCEGPDLLMAFWQAITTITILDPTGGSGAFIFAALNILEPLYEACLDRMEGFLAEWGDKKSHPNYHKKFTEVLARVDAHPNRRYFVLKSIILNNLYAVDIMEEAVEICKLRLFLKLASQISPDPTKDNLGIEPLPDIDFNIRAGNTLVGYATADEVRKCMTEFGSGQMRLGVEDELQSFSRFSDKLQIADAAFRSFRLQQTELGGTVTAQDKAELRAKLKSLEDELNRYLAKDYGVKVSDKAAFAKWIKSHQPFHWFVQFYGIMSAGGFDVIIGNPPYVEYSKVRAHYRVLGYSTEGCGNIYTYVLERSVALSSASKRLGMIIPSGGFSTARMDTYQNLLCTDFNLAHISYFSGDANPSRLFEGVKYRLAIFLGRLGNQTSVRFTTRYLKWYSVERDTLFSRITYEQCMLEEGYLRFAKLGVPAAARILRKLAFVSPTLAVSLRKSGSHALHYHRSPVSWIRAMDFEPYFKSATRTRSDDHLRDLFVESKDMIKGLGAILNSTHFFFWFITQGNCRDIAGPDIENYPVGNFREVASALAPIFDRLMSNLRKNSRTRVYNYETSGRVEYQEFYPGLSKPILDEIDTVLAKHYGFTAEELDFILNYDIKYRLGRDTEAEED